MRQILKKIFHKTPENIPLEKKYYDLEEAFFELYIKCRPYTMLSIERLYANYKAIEYICKNKIGGAIVECGVWKGGSMMLMIETLKLFNDLQRDIYLYDTFEGMPQPDAVDKKASGISAFEKWKQNQRSNYNEWCYSPLEEVKNNINTTAYPTMYLHFIKGKVEDTIPHVIPEKIALLRLDTDWYSSTKHELVHLFPNLEKGGVIIIDDYGSWQGARKAVDEYLSENNIKILKNLCLQKI